MVNQINNNDRPVMIAQEGLPGANQRSLTISERLNLIENDLLKSYESSPTEAEALLNKSAKAAMQVLMIFYNKETEDIPAQALKAVILLVKCLNALAQLTDASQDRESALAVILTIINGDYDRSQIKTTDSSAILIITLFRILQFTKAHRNNLIGSDFFKSMGKYQLWLEQIDSLTGLKKNAAAEILYSTIQKETGEIKLDEFQSKLMACIHSKMGSHYLWEKKDDNKAEIAFKKSFKLTGPFKRDSWMAGVDRENHFGLAQIYLNKGQDGLALKEYQLIIDSISSAHSSN
ncbi:hypothetical protein HZC34_05280 [Candidatus Saganbacteria bacterium]|nr:hypothetical protein [Candidatus Saganbacteria bacterium]